MEELTDSEVQEATKELGLIGDVEATALEELEAEKELETLGEIRISGIQAIGYHCVYIESGTVEEAEELHNLFHSAACLINKMRERAGSKYKAWFTTLYNETPVSELDARTDPCGSLIPITEKETEDDGA